MLNKNQSKKSNSWKYALVLPVLVAFVIFFQVKVIAQEKETTLNEKSYKAIDFVWTKDATKEEMKSDAERAKELNVKLIFSKIKRNTNGEITAIKIEFKGDKGQKGATYIDGDTPIKPIYFSKYDDKMGFGKSNRERLAFIDRENQNSLYSDDDIAELAELPELPEMAEMAEMPELPEITEMPEMEEIDLPSIPEVQELSGVSNPPRAPRPPKSPRKNERHVIIRQDGDVKEVWVNGEKVSEEKIGDFEIPDITIDTKGPKGPKGPKGSKNVRRMVVDSNTEVIHEDGDAIVIVTKGKNGTRTERIEKTEIRRKAMQDAKAEMERHKPEMERARIEMERARPEMERARREMDRAKPEMERARQEIIRAKAEIEQAKAEIEREKADMEREKAELKNRKS